MAHLHTKHTYGFEDVSIVPAAHSAIESRRDVDTSVQLTPNVRLETPIIASPMADVCDWRMAAEIARAGGVGCIHRFMEVEEQAQQVHMFYEAVTEAQRLQVMAAVGTGERAIERAAALVAAGIRTIIVDVAFLNEKTLRTCREIKQRWPDVEVISGNVATVMALPLVRRRAYQQYVSALAMARRAVHRE